jgi:hypothetical protein
MSVVDRVVLPVFLTVAATCTLLWGDTWIITVGGVSSEWDTPAGAALLVSGAVAVYLFIVVFVLASATLFAPLTDRILRGSREKVVFFYLAGALSEVVDRYPGEHRLPHVRHLSMLATCVNDLRKEIVALDRRHRQIVVDRIEQAGLAVDEKVLWVTLPKRDTQEHLREFILDFMATMLIGNYDDLPRAEPVPQVSRRVRVKAVLSFLRSIVIAIIPLAILWVLRFANVIMPESVGATVTLVGALWAVVNLLIAIDPAVRDRIEILKNVSSLFPGSKSDK